MVEAERFASRDLVVISWARKMLCGCNMLVSKFRIGMFGSAAVPFGIDDELVCYCWGGCVRVSGCCTR